MTREVWLKSQDHEKAARAAVKCQHAGALCMQDGFCHYGGECFRTGNSAMVRACEAIQNAAQDEPADIAAEMLVAATLLKASWRDSDDATLPDARGTAR